MAAFLLSPLLLSGCSGGRGPNFSQSMALMFGPSTEGREAPPGAGDPYPNLGSVPERPVRPTPGQRQNLTSLLEAERAQSARPLAGGDMRSPRPSGTEGDRSMPLGPPRPAVIGAAPPIIATAPVLPITPASQPQPTVPAVPSPAPAPAVPASAASGGLPAPSAAPPTRTAPVPTSGAPPAVTMSPGPPPPPPPALLTPGAAPPPPPAPDLLAPAPRTR